MHPILIDKWNKMIASLKSKICASYKKWFKVSITVLLILLAAAVVVLGVPRLFTQLFAQSRTYSVAKQTYTMSSTPGEGQVKGDDSVQARTKDGQQISMDASVTYSIDPAKIIDLNITWQNRYQDELVRPQSRGIIRDTVAQYGVDEVVSTKRAEMEKTITDNLRQKSLDFPG